MKTEIKSWFTGRILFSLETDSLKSCVEVAIKRGANLCRANLSGALLNGAVMNGAHLRGADMRGVDLSRAVLIGALLNGANLSGADMRGANMRGADMRGAVLNGADMRGADMCGAKGIDKFPIQIPGHKHFIQTTQAGNLRIGCEIHSFKEWRERAESLGQENGYSPLDVEIYKLHIEHIAKVSQLLWNKKKANNA